MSNITWVCEIGSNHKGVMAIAYEMIRQAALANPSGVCKFQFRDPHDPIRGMPMHNASELAEACDHYGMEMMASIFSFEALELAKSVGMNRYKIAYQMKNSGLAGAIMREGKETFASGIENGRINQNVRGIACVSCYPTYPRDMWMPDSFGDKPGEFYGYSSHMHGISDKLIAVARGAQYIEAHVTLSKVERTIKDNAFSLSFDEFAQMASIGREMARLI